jgi:hypothetical protein
MDFSKHFLIACDNDLVTVFHGDYVVSRARRDVKKGSFVTRSAQVHPLERTKAERGGVFEVNVLGKCECRACKEDWRPQPLRRALMTPGLCCAECMNDLDAKVMKCPRCGSIVEQEIDHVFEDPIENRRYGICGKNGCQAPLKPAYEVVVGYIKYQQYMSVLYNLATIYYSLCLPHSVTAIRPISGQ